MNKRALPELFSIQQLLSADLDYLIPMYQRNYAWGEGEITQLIQDVIDYQPDAQNYYIGTLVVFRRKGNGTRPVFEVIDGQQRLTTLSLLASYLRYQRTEKFDWYRRLNIDFESREHSRQTFAALFDRGAGVGIGAIMSGKKINDAILHGYEVIARVLPRKLAEHGLEGGAFCDYLLGKVQIMRVEVPEDTDLNHYFEVMNSRGEQLEKHEVLKARMLEQLETDEDRHALHGVWEACANMDKYVQAGFTSDQRRAVFGEGGNDLPTDDFDALSRQLAVPADNASLKTGPGLKLAAIIDLPISKAVSAKETDEAERFHSVINFPNFLLQVLRVSLGEDAVKLDDKRLLKAFEDHVLHDRKTPESIAKIKKFTVALLRCKFLFDQFIIKRELLKQPVGWSLQRYKDGAYVNTFGSDEPADTGINRRVLMLLSAFHVSAPTLTYKHWLNAALRWLYQAEGAVEPDAYLRHMESVAKAFVFDRAVLNPKLDYFEIIYERQGVCGSRPTDVSEKLLKERLTYDEIQNNLVFNYLDYLLWLRHKTGNAKIEKFTFTFRSSVEHFHPQNPLPGQPAWDDSDLHDFGNLCLISHSKNSRLSNFSPQSKREFYSKNEIDSIKQYLMMQADWGKDEMQVHAEQMLTVLHESLSVPACEPAS